MWSKRLSSHSSSWSPLFLLFSVLSVAFALAACEVEKSSSDSSGDGTPPPAGDGSGKTGGAGGEVDKSNIDTFAVRAVSEDPLYTLYLSKDGDGVTPCEPNDNNKIVTCQINVDEQNLFFFGLRFTVLAPRNQCDFVSYYPYYYSVAPVEFMTPTRVAFAENGDGDLLDPATVAGFDVPDPGEGNYGGSADIYYFFGGVWISHESLYGNAAQKAEDLRCPWDYSNVGGVEDGENCCRGSYGLFKSSDGEFDFDVRNDWGGTMSACFRGPGVEQALNEGEPETGLPFWQDYNVPATGFAETYVINPPIQHPVREIIYAANWFDTSSWEEFPVPLLDGYPYHTFLCLDQNREVNYKINIQVREWNTADELQKFMSGNSKVGGNEGAPFGGEPNDDFPDWNVLNENSWYPLSRFNLNPANIHPFMSWVDGSNNLTTEWLGFRRGASRPNTPAIIDNP